MMRKPREDARRDKIREADRIRSANRPIEVKRAAARKWREANRAVASARSAASRLKKLDYDQARTRARKIKDADKVAAHDANRRARIAGATGAGWTPADVTARLKDQRGRCALCAMKLRRPFHRDYIMPLAKGGTHDRRNLQLLCPPCNLSKGARDPIDHAQSLGLLL
jgi:5-methylcytosine-specific restriction endonuclease McrA